MNVSRTLDHIAAWLPVKPAVYFCMLIAWGVVLWFLSAGNPNVEHAPDIPHLDKLAHFTYFFWGGATMAAYLGLQWLSLSRFRIFAIVTLVFCILGRLDEYHQSFTPGRMANDTGDWGADILGAGVGALVVIWLLLPRLRGKCGKNASNTQNIANSLDC